MKPSVICGWQYYTDCVSGKCGFLNLLSQRAKLYVEKSKTYNTFYCQGHEDCWRKMLITLRRHIECTLHLVSVTMRPLSVLYMQQILLATYPTVWCKYLLFQFVWSTLVKLNAPFFKNWITNKVIFSCDSLSFTTFISLRGWYIHIDVFL